jgi:hypothetical protein
MFRLTVLRGRRHTTLKTKKRKKEMRRSESPGAALARLRWTKDTERRVNTAPARAALAARFERAIDPSVTDPAERARLADQAKRAFYRRLQRRSIAARRANAERGAA